MQWGTVLAALGGLAWSLINLRQGADWRAVALLIVAMIAAEALKVTIYQARQQTLSLSLSVVVILSAIAIDPHFGPPVGLLAGLVHVIAIRQRAAEKIAVNVANLVVAATAASWAYQWLRPAGDDFTIGSLAAAGVAVVAYYLVNLTIIAAMISLHSGRSFRAVVRESAWFGPTNILLGLTGAFLASIHELLGLMGAVMFLVPLLVMRFTLGFYARRSEQTIKMLEDQADSLDHQARHDALTGLPNRTEIQAQVEARIARGLDDAPFALLLIDLDHFKEINDTFGHHHGDLLLQQIGPRLQSLLASTDVIARLGGDEFGVLLSEADGAEAGMFAERLLEALRDVFVVDGHRLDIRASIGVAVAPNNGSDSVTLLRRADVAMYVSKRDHSGYALYSAEQDEYSPARLALVADLREGLQRNELVVYYQPKIDLRSGRPHGAEALVRWQHPRQGLIPPNLFIPLAEHTGLIKPLTMYVLDAALTECRGWLASGWDLSVAVNASVQDLHDETFPDAVQALLERCRVAPRHLRIEVTEGAMMEHIGRTRDVLTRLRAMGVGVSVDDFGTGYSSLTYLKRLPVDELKVDRSFVQHLATDNADAAIVLSTIGLAHALGLFVVAEGAEDMLTVRRLVEMDCDSVQGYVFSKPLPSAEFTAFLTSFAAPELGQAADPLAA
jgi:diguanylate cyclase (GGDEF)-like protein